MGLKIGINPIKIRRIVTLIVHSVFTHIKGGVADKSQCELSLLLLSRVRTHSGMCGETGGVWTRPGAKLLRHLLSPVVGRAEDCSLSLSCICQKVQLSFRLMVS